jgi:hypothetical protein
MGLSAGPVTKKSGLGIFGDFWGDEADSAQKVDTLAGRRVSSTPVRRLTLGESRRSHDPPLVMFLDASWGKMQYNCGS